MSRPWVAIVDFWPCQLLCHYADEVNFTKEVMFPQHKESVIPISVNENHVHILRGGNKEFIVVYSGGKKDGQDTHSCVVKQRIGESVQVYNVYT